jgi:hypothetical protein
MGRKAVKIASAALVAVSLFAAPAAGQVAFSGTRTNIDAPGAPAARCGSRTTTSVVNAPPTSTSSGLSNFGAFTPTLSHCIQLPPSLVGPTPFDLGEFSFVFENGDTLFGTYAGELSPLSPGLFGVSQNHLVTGGTGLFAAVTGSFASSGTLDFRSGRPTVNQSFSGLLNIPAIPEPASWMMMLIGFGLTGGAMRVTRAKGVRRMKVLV